MSAEAGARRIAAAAMLGDFRAALGPAAWPAAPDMASWALRLARALDDLLASPEEPADGDGGRLDAIRGLLEAFDWEHDDRQYALEAIERIAGASRTESGAERGGLAVIIPADVPAIITALADAAAWREATGDDDQATAYQELAARLGDDQ